MKKSTKTILALIIVIAVFTGGAITLLVTKFNQDAIKSKIIQIVRDKTGNELVINGDIQWSLFPRLGIKIHNISLNKTTRAKEAGLSVKLMPLLSGQITLGRLILKDFNLQDSFKIGKLDLYCENIVISKPFKIEALKFSGDLKINAAQVGKLNVDNFSTVINGSDGVINCSKIRFSFYHGDANGSAVIDMRNETPQINLKLALDRVAMRSLLVDVAKYGDFSGNFSLNTNINMRGKTGEAMLNSISGGGNVLISIGSYHGVDIPFEVRRASAILNQKSIPQETRPPHTDFDRLTTSFRIHNALLSTGDLLVQAPDYMVTGQGTANIASQRLDLLLNASITHEKDFFVPIKIFGPFAKLSIKPNIPAVMQQVVKKEIGKQLERLNVPKNLLDALPLDKLFH